MEIKKFKIPNKEKKARKYVTNPGRNTTKHKKIKLADGTRIELLALGHKDKDGYLRCSNVCASTYISGLDFRDKFKVKTYEDASRRIDSLFKSIKRKIENSNKNLIVVLTYPTNITASKNNGVFIDISLHITEMEFTSKILDDQRVLMWLLDRTILEIRNSFK